MAYCKYCGCQLESDAAFCASCGKGIARNFNPKFWYIAENGRQTRILEESLILKIRNREIAANTLVVNAEIRNWVPVCQTSIWKENFVPPVSEPVSPYTYPQPSVSPPQERCLGLAITGMIFGFIGFFIFLPIVFSTLGMLFGIIAVLANPGEKGELTKAIWQYKNRARGFGWSATIIGAIGVISMILNMSR